MNLVKAVSFLIQEAQHSTIDTVLYGDYKTEFAKSLAHLDETRQWNEHAGRAADKIGELFAKHV